MTRWLNNNSKDLFKALLSLKNEQEVKSFLRDLLTEQEIIEFGKRWKAARELNNNTPYSKIQKDTGLSSTTVARISKFLKKGMGGYKLAISRLKHHHRPASSGKGL